MKDINWHLQSLKNSKIIIQVLHFGVFLLSSSYYIWEITLAISSGLIYCFSQTTHFTCGNLLFMFFCINPPIIDVLNIFWRLPIGPQSCETAFLDLSVALTLKVHDPISHHDVFWVCGARPICLDWPQPSWD